jgi:hypothetical protein
MARVRKIETNLPRGEKNYFVVDACFLANKYLPTTVAPTKTHEKRLTECQTWWKEIDRQVDGRGARVYVPDICIAESFKVIAKKYFEEHWFTKPQDMNNAKVKLRRDVVTPARTLRGARRHIKYHDVPTTRDVIIAVDRFYEAFMKKGLKVQIADLVLVATAKYLIDFYDLPKKRVHIITLDRELRKGSKVIGEIPNAYDPTLAEDAFARVFRQKADCGT